MNMHGIDDYVKYVDAYVSICCIYRFWIYTDNDFMCIIKMDALKNVKFSSVNSSHEVQPTIRPFVAFFDSKHPHELNIFSMCPTATCILVNNLDFLRTDVNVQLHFQWRKDG